VTVASDWVDLEQAHDLTGERARVMLLLRQVFADRPDMAATPPACTGARPSCSVTRNGCRGCCGS
jgi:hypothetical protein